MDAIIAALVSGIVTLAGVLIANGKSKSSVIKQLHDCTRIDPQFPASFLLMHPNVTVICDREAASQLHI